jgi:ankyrin repeat protein
MSKYLALYEDIRHFSETLLESAEAARSAREKVVLSFHSLSREEQQDYLQAVKEEVRILTSNSNESNNDISKDYLALAIIETNIFKVGIPQEKQIEYLDLLLEARTIDEELVPGYNTPLEIVISQGSLPLAKFLIKKKHANAARALNFLINSNYIALGLQELVKPDLSKRSRLECYQYILKKAELNSLNNGNMADLYLPIRNHISKIKDDYIPQLKSDDVLLFILKAMDKSLKRFQKSLKKQFLNNKVKFDVSTLPGNQNKNFKQIVTIWSPSNFLHLAIILLETEKCQQYIENEALAQSKDRDGNTILHYASCFPWLKTLLPLENIAYLDVRNQEGYTPLMYACRSGDIEFAEFLIKKGANFNATGGPFGMTPLCLACRSGNMEVSAYLIKIGAHVNAADKDGWTPLICASESGNGELVEDLIKRGAAINVADNKGMTALHLAASKGNKNVVIELLKQKWLIVNATTDQEGETALHCAVTSAQKEVVIELLKKEGVDINALSAAGFTPLDVNQIMRKTMETIIIIDFQPGGSYEEVMDILLERGARYNKCKNNDAHAPSQEEKRHNLDNKKKLSSKLSNMLEVLMKRPLLMGGY